MRHRKKTVKLGRTGTHRDAMLSNLVCSLIEQKRVTTTLAKAKAARPLAERMVTLGKDGSVAARRRAISKLQQRERVAELFTTIAPSFAEREGGYTRIYRLGRRSSDSSDMAILEWVEGGAPSSKAKAKKKVKAKTPEPEPVEEPEAEAVPTVDEKPDEAAVETEDASPDESANPPEEESVEETDSEKPAS